MLLMVSDFNDGYEYYVLKSCLDISDVSSLLFSDMIVME